MKKIINKKQELNKIADKLNVISDLLNEIISFEDAATNIYVMKKYQRSMRCISFVKNDIMDLSKIYAKKGLEV